MNNPSGRVRRIADDYRDVIPPGRNNPCRGQVQVSAILLNWKRPENLERIVRYLDKRQYISEIILWNNSKQTIKLTASKTRLRIINSSENLKDLAKYKAASLATNAHCFYQDDDWFTGEYIDAMYAAYCIRPDTLHTATSASIWLENWTWSCYSTSLDLHAEIGWIGCGAFFPKRIAIDYLSILSRYFGPEERLISDYGFALTQNQPTVQMQVVLRKLNQSDAFSQEESFQQDLHQFGKKLHLLLPKFASKEVPRPNCVVRHASNRALLFTSFLPFDFRYRAHEFIPHEPRFGTDRVSLIEDDQRRQFLANPYSQALGTNPDKRWITRIAPGDVWGIILLAPAIVRIRVSDSVSGMALWRIYGLSENHALTSATLSETGFAVQSIFSMALAGDVPVTASIKVSISPAPASRAAD